jgi:ABC-type transport system substrate-binding protein
VYPYDPVLADELLVQAGHPMPHPSSSVSGDDAPARFTFTCLIPANTAPFEEIAVLVQRQLHEVGVHMRLESVDPRALERRITDNAWDAVLVPQQTGKTLARLYSLYHSAERFNYFGYSGADELLDALRHAATRDALALATAAFQQRLYDDPPAIFLAERYKVRAVSRRFEIPPVLPGRDVIFSLWQWKQAD